MKPFLPTLLLPLALMQAPSVAHGEAAAAAPTRDDGVLAEVVRTADFDLFVDPPTRFVFVKLPAGWRFVGRVDGEALARLPASVHRSLLVARPDASEAAPLAPRDAAVAERTNGTERGPSARRSRNDLPS